MLNLFDSDAPSLSPQQIAANFRTLGWMGMSMQLLLGAIPLLVLIGFLFFGPNRQAGSPFALGTVLAITCVGLLLFSVYWCFRYTQLGQDIADPNFRPPRSLVNRDLRIGLLVNLGSVISAVAIAFWQTTNLTFRLLSQPPASTTIARSQTDTVITSGARITASNLIMLQATIHTIAAGIVGILIALWLLALMQQRSR